MPADEAGGRASGLFKMPKLELCEVVDPAVVPQHPARGDHVAPQPPCPHPPQKSANGKAKLTLAGGGGRAAKGENKPSRSCAFPSELKEAEKAASSVAAVYKA